MTVHTVSLKKPYRSLSVHYFHYGDLSRQIVNLYEVF